MAERTTYPKVALCRHTSYRDSHWGETTQRRSIIRSTRTLGIRQGHGFDRPTAALLAAPSRYHYTLTNFLFRRPAGPKRQGSPPYFATLPGRPAIPPLATLN